MTSPTFKQRLFAACFALLLICSQSAVCFAAELFVSDRATNRVLSFDEETGAFVRVVTDTGLDEPTGLTFGPAGFLYVTNLQSTSAASVVKVDPVTGTTTSFITNVVGPGGIAYHETSDTLFVSEFGQFDGDEVFRYDSTGSLIQTIGTGSAATARAGITFDSVGNLYVSESNVAGVGSVLKYDAPVGDPLDDYGTTATTFASGGDVTLLIPAPAAGFNGLTFDAAGDLFVASLIGQSLIKYEVSGGVVTEGNPFGAPFPYPSGVLIGQDGDILVSGLGNDNPADPFYGNMLFPGSITRFSAITTASTPLLIGDNNGDATVDNADLTEFESSFGTDNGADLDGDFDTDGVDFLKWQGAFGNEGISGSFQPTGIARYEPVGPLVESFTIPEPTSACLTAMLVLGIWPMGHRRRRSMFPGASRE